ncbi:MAG: metallophosphoesterase [Candidatus Thorarchaeota archaeon]|nr:MAG: metallophosphoesterase [Candidatus Thorarchaeota archaeon]
MKQLGLLLDWKFRYTLCALLILLTPTWCNATSSAQDDAEFRFIAYGDTRGDGSESVSPLHVDIVGLYIQHDPDLIIHSGDMVNHGGESYQWPLFNDSMTAVWELGIPFYGAAGNHEVYTDVWGVSDDDYSNYLDYFDYTDVIDQPGETELHYSFDMDGIHFIILNTVEEWTYNDFTCSTAQMNWLEDDLAAGHEFIVVAFHNPAWSIRADRPERWAQAESIRNTFHSMFIDNGVDIVFNGHDHCYYRTVRDGIFYVITGGGGAPLCEIQTEDTVWQDGDVGFSDYHYCLAKVASGLLSVEVYLMNGTVADDFDLDVSAASPPPLFEGTTLIVVGTVVVIALLVIVALRRRAQ